MIKVSTAQLWVHDQDEALAFYTEKVGMEVRVDATLAEMGDFRWLTVGMPGQPDFAIVLMAIPGPPLMDDETTEQVKTLMSKGYAGTVFLETDDCLASYETYRGRLRQDAASLANLKFAQDRKFILEETRTFLRPVTKP